MAPVLGVPNQTPGGTESDFWGYRIRSRGTESGLGVPNQTPGGTESDFWGYRIRSGGTESDFWGYRIRLLGGYRIRLLGVRWESTMAMLAMTRDVLRRALAWCDSRDGSGTMLVL